MEAYIKDYPRPQLVRPSWLNLNGEWDFCFDDKNEGLAAGWQRVLPQGKKIQVPFTYETKMSGIGDETAHNTVWYARKLHIDANKLTDRILLHFEGSDYQTDVWVNGEHVGAHTGGYARFSFDITHCVTAGENTVTVRVCDELDEQRPRGKQRWTGYNFGCWYVQTTGIWKTVWLEYVPRSYIQSVKMTPCLAKNTVRAEAVIEPCKTQEMFLRARVSFAGKLAGETCVPVCSGRAALEVDLYNTAIDEWGVKLWSPEQPDLYDVTFELIIENNVLDTILSYVGMREIAIEKDQVLLNGRPLYQRLILDQGYWKDSHLTPPSEEALVEDIDKIMALGYNGLRKHQKTEDERFLYWCDVKGVLVWSEMAAGYLYSDIAVQDFTTQWMEIVRQNYNHPCVITWTPINESWGVRDIKTDKTQQNFTQAIYYLTKSFDAMRPVIVNDGWEHTISDIITLHDYQESGDVFYRQYTERKEDMLANRLSHNDHKFVFADGFAYRGQPVIISEFGGIAFADEAGWGYGNQVKNSEDFIRRFESITLAIKKLPYVCGYCYTQVTDVQQEVNGLMDINREFKVDSARIREINLKK